MPDMEIALRLNALRAERDLLRVITNELLAAFDEMLATLGTDDPAVVRAQETINKCRTTMTTAAELLP